MNLERRKVIRRRMDNGCHILDLVANYLVGEGFTVLRIHNKEKMPAYVFIQAQVFKHSFFLACIYSSVDRRTGNDMVIVRQNNSDLLVFNPAEPDSFEQIAAAMRRIHQYLGERNGKSHSKTGT